MPSWLREEDFRAHAVMPLIAEGHSIGALVIDSRRPRRLDENQVRFFQLLANQAAIAIEKARLHQESLKRQRLEEELSVARQIQLSLLPKAPPMADGWDFAAFYRPARLIGGNNMAALYLAQASRLRPCKLRFRAASANSWLSVVNMPPSPVVRFLVA